MNNIQGNEFVPGRRRIVIICPDCGHRNIPHPSPVEACKLYLTDKMPPCKKCKRELQKADADANENSVYIKLARRQLAEQGIIV